MKRSDTFRTINLRKPAVRWTVLALLAVMIGVAVLMTVRAGDDSQASAAPANAASRQQSLKSQVENAKGEPNPGRDPANQPQNSLAAAAASPTGNGRLTDTPAKDVHGDHNHHAKHSDVYGDPKKTGINSAGCFIDYGIPGEQCVAAGLAGSDGKLSCAELRTKFPNGAKVSGTDRFKLDKNGDGTACGAND